MTSQRNFSLRAVNLNLLPVLQALLRERHLARAADALHLSRPAVSAALAHLREVLDDPLLVRVGQRMSLTPHAESLIAPVNDLCAGLTRLFEGAGSDLWDARRCFVMATSDYGAALFGPALHDALRAQAPGLSVHFVNHSAHSMDALSEGSVDFVVIPRGALVALQWPPDQSALLWKEEHVHVVRRDHPLAARDEVSEDDIAPWGQVSFEPQWYPDPGGRGDFVPETGKRSAASSTIMVEQFCVPALVALETGAVATMPARLLARLQRHLPLQQLGNARSSFEMMLAWGAITHDDARHFWFRELLLRLATPVGGS
ncbi:LysR family transcriptional regulator [Xanthobacter autotrophicus]|uniref:LysR family transcriptional regulator n=1 Tax=Xanthobacter autotrophicus TaxID=280 RepID=UPI00372C46BF